jgi:hypothetical protein
MKMKIVAIVGLALLSAMSAAAQDMKTNLMTVPFAFVAGNKTLPAGEYRIQFNLQTKSTTLLSPSGPVAATETLPNGEGYRQDALEFHLVGDTWFLEQVKVHGYAQRLSPSKLEKRELAEQKSQGRQTLMASVAPAQ